jgi:hypothetical protein
MIIVLIIGQGPATGKEMFFSAEQLKNYCNSISYDGSVKSAKTEATADALTCTEYIKGIVDAFGFSVWVTNTQPFICIPEGTTAISLINVVKYFMFRNKNEYQFYETPAAAIVTIALTQAFPCPGAEDNPFENDILW